MHSHEPKKTIYYTHTHTYASKINVEELITFCLDLNSEMRSAEDLSFRSSLLALAYSAGEASGCLQSTQKNKLNHHSTLATKRHMLKHNITIQKKKRKEYCRKGTRKIVVRPDPKFLPQNINETTRSSESRNTRN